MQNDKTNLQYLISRHLLEDLLEKGLITKREFELIDEENKKALLI